MKKIQIFHRFLQEVEEKLNHIMSITKRKHVTHERKRRKQLKHVLEVRIYHRRRRILKLKSNACK